MGSEGAVAHTIGLALAPVFVLVAIGNIMNNLSSRLARVVDRSRQLQARHRETSGAEHDRVVWEIRVIDRRIHLINRSILFLVLSALSIGLCVTLLFVEELFGAQTQQVAAGAFLLAIFLLMAALLHFLREVRAATASLRIPQDLLELERKL